jgi:UDPglucose--hexose-1-phosphate uridylyltransferase
VNAPEPRTVVDPTTGRPILMAPKRQNRPMHTGAKASDKRCPFCSGNEEDTPPEVDAARTGDTTANQPGWSVRAFANLYPATKHHEVIAEGATHYEHPCDLDIETWRAAITVWQRRIIAIEAIDGIACAFLFKNVGARAGASIAHNHSQVIGLPQLPPRLELEREQQRRHGRCLICASLATAEVEQRIVVATEQFVALAPDPPKLPFETWLMPRDCTSDFLQADPAALATAMQQWLQAIGGGLNRPPCNLWLHRVPNALLNAQAAEVGDSLEEPLTNTSHESFHWHFELQPRTGQLAGLELGGDMYINSVPADVTAARMRAGLTN